MNKKMPHYLGHRERLKARFTAGPESLADYELLELALSYALPRKDVKPLAKDLLARFRNVSGILSADADELRAIDGIKDHTAVLLKLIHRLAALCTREEAGNKDLLACPDAVVRHMHTLLRGSRDEEFHALFLDAGNRLLSAELLHRGTVNQSAVYPRAIVERAIHHHAAGVIIAHNHPGGSLTPSDDDRRVTEAVRAALKTVDASLLDHIIIADRGYFSWKEHSLL